MFDKKATLTGNVHKPYKITKVEVYLANDLIASQNITPTWDNVEKSFFAQKFFPNLCFCSKIHTKINVFT